jgi:hemolysin activation/secretion protein
MKAKPRCLGFIAFFTCALGGFPVPGLAQAVDSNLPGSADPGRVLQDLRLPVRPDAPQEQVPSRKKTVATPPPGTENIKFTLRGLSIEGMTAYSAEEIAALYQPYLDSEISVATLFEIMGKIQQKYLDDGYALTKVVLPNQNIEGGRVRFSVLEGHVGEVEVDPAIQKAPIIEDAVQQIAQMKPLNVKKLERIMLILNDTVDKNVSAVLMRPKEKESREGVVRLALKQNPPEKKIAGSFSIDDYGSKFSGPLQAKATARAFHIGPAYSKLEVTAIGTAPLEEQRLGVVDYSLPILGVSGAVVTISASSIRTEPGSSLADLDIKGKAYNVGAEVSYPLIRQRDQTLKVNAGFEWKNAHTKILGEELYDDRMRILRAGLNYNFTDDLAGYNLLDIHFSKGLEIFGVREAGSPDLSRQDGRPDFKKVEFNAARLQALPRNFEVLATVSGQYAFDPLLSSEEFGFGGGFTGRGYDPSEITGDRGIAASLELRYGQDLRVLDASMKVQPYVFYDFGKIWNIDQGGEDNISAASGGLGVRINVEEDWDINFSLAKVFTKSAENELKYENDLGARALFSISRSF